MEKENSPANRYTLDTCVGRKAYENPNYLNMLNTTIDFENSRVLFTTVSIYEIENRANYSFAVAKENLESSLGIKIHVGKITGAISSYATYLESNYELLHYPDNQILAHAVCTDSVLITCDQDLVTVAKQIEHPVLNPDKLSSDVTARKPQSRFRRIVKNTMKTPRVTKQKIKSLALKPGKKIVWRAFN